MKSARSTISTKLTRSRGEDDEVYEVDSVVEVDKGDEVDDVSEVN